MSLLIWRFLLVLVGIILTLFQHFTNKRDKKCVMLSLFQAPILWLHLSVFSQHYCSVYDTISNCSKVKGSKNLGLTFHCSCQFHLATQRHYGFISYRQNKFLFFLLTKSILFFQAADSKINVFSRNIL